MKADLVIMANRAEPDQTDTRHFAADVSYTGAARDAVRVLRNDAIVTRVTGRSCEAVLVSIRDDETGEQIQEGLLHWCQLGEQDVDNPNLGDNLSCPEDGSQRNHEPSTKNRKCVGCRLKSQPGTITQMQEATAISE